MLAASMMLAGCQPDESDTDISPDDTKKLTVLTVVDGDGEQTRFDIGWHSGRMDEISVWLKDSDGGEAWLLYEVQPSYNSQHQMESIWLYSYEERSGVTVDLYRSDGRLDQVYIPHEGTIDVAYNGQGRVSSLSADGERVRLSWDGDNPVRIDGDGHILISYDDRRNPLGSLLAALFGSWNVSLCNPTAIIDTDGGAVSFRYNYDGEWPSRCRVSTDDESFELYFKYSDGSGADAPGRKAANAEVDGSAARPANRHGALRLLSLLTGVRLAQ